MRLLVVAYSLLFSVNAIKKPDDISSEMFCMGCQVTVKELDFMLSRKPTRGMGETVTRALKRVCDIHNFDKYDVDSKKVLKVCKHIRGDEELEAVLISEYGRKHAVGKQTTYLDINQMICGTVLKVCHEPGKLETNDEDGGIVYDPVVEDFYVKHGKKVRIPHPVQEPRTEPNETTEQESRENTEPKDGLQTESTENIELKDGLQATEKPEVVTNFADVNDDADTHDEL